MNSRFFVHEKGLCDAPDENIGDGTRIWAFAHVLPEARIGAGCNICDGVFIENDVVIGDRVTIKCGVQVWDGVRIEDDVFIGPNATFTNDLFPRSKVYPEAFANTVLRAGCSIGANATLLPGIEIGTNAMVGAGAVVTRSVPPNAIVVGNPAQIVGYVGDLGREGTASAPTKTSVIGRAPLTGPVDLGIGKCSLHPLKVVRDLRGDLTVGEFERDVPFEPKRYFLVLNVPTTEVRGEHAHKACHQFLICIRGSVAVLLDDGENRSEIVLDSPDRGIFMPAMTWGTQYKYSSDAILLVFASEHYDAKDYIRTYPEFIDALRGQS